jgi:hypothetical protein
MRATAEQVQAVIDGTEPCPRDTENLPELIAAATREQRVMLRQRVFAEYSVFVADLIWRRAEAASYAYRSAEENA